MQNLVCIWFVWCAHFFILLVTIFYLNDIVLLNKCNHLLLNIICISSSFDITSLIHFRQVYNCVSYNCVPVISVLNSTQKYCKGSVNPLIVQWQPSCNCYTFISPSLWNIYSEWAQSYTFMTCSVSALSVVRITPSFPELLTSVCCSYSHQHYPFFFFSVLVSALFSSWLRLGLDSICLGLGVVLVLALIHCSLGLVLVLVKAVLTTSLTHTHTHVHASNTALVVALFICIVV